jgi:large repetitive protein
VQQIIKCLILLILSGCLNDKLGESIILPQGDVVVIDLSDIRNVSEELFDLNLMENNQSHSNNNLEHLTQIPVVGKKDRVRFVLSKNIIIKGASVVSVTLLARQNSWYALTIPGQVIRPNMITTLSYLLLANYPHKKLSSYSTEEINFLDQLIAERVREKALVFQIPADYDPDFLFRFYRNVLSSDIVFLEAIKKLNINYQYSPEGEITSSIKPFGYNNRVPTLDFRATTPLEREVLGKENNELVVRAATQDLDGDPVFFLWSFQGQPIVFNDHGNRFRWTPGFEDGRAQTYPLELWFSDGGVAQRATWALKIDNQNRNPIFDWHCPSRVNKDIEVNCRISFSDPDGELVAIQVNQISGSNPVWVNDQLAPVIINGENEVNLRWTPNNGDAINRAAAFNVELVDESFGRTVTRHQMIVDGESRPPEIVQGITSVVDGSLAAEWNSCANESSLGASIPAYQFSITVRDPDNEGLIPASPPDDVIVALIGPLAGQIRPAPPIKQILNNGHYRFFFEWRPTHNVTSGVVTFRMVDSHGKFSNDPRQLTALNFNALPCLNFADWTTHVNQRASSSVTLSISDQDGVGINQDQPFFEFYDFNVINNLYGLKHLQNFSSREHFILRRKFFEEQVTYRERASSFTLRVNSRADLALSSTSRPIPMAGYIKITRPDSSRNIVVTIPKDTQLRVISPATTVGGFENAALTLDYRLTYPITFGRGDVEVWAPVTLVSETPVAGSLTELGPIVPQVLPGVSGTLSGVTVSNPETFVLDELTKSIRGRVRFTNANNFAVNLYRYQVIRSLHQANQVGYEVVLPMDIEIGPLSSLDVPVWYRKREVPAGTIAQWLGTGYSDFSLSTIDGLQNNNAPELRATSNYGWTPSLIKVRPLDGHFVGRNEINQWIDEPSGIPSGGGGSLVITHEPGLGGSIIFGEVTLTRSNTTGSWRLPSFTRMRTNNNTRFETVEDVTFNPGESSQVVWIRRINYVGIRPNNPRRDHARITYNLSSYANSPMNLTTSNLLVADEVSPQTAASGFLIDLAEVSQRPQPYYQVHNYWYPNDPFQNFILSGLPIIKPANQGGPVAGQDAFKFCRELGTDFNSACTTCGDILDNRYYFRSNQCFLRYNLNEQDLSKTLELNLNFHERQHDGNAFNNPIGGDYLNMSPGGTALFATRMFNIKIQVKEKNDPPLLVDENYQLIPGNTGKLENEPLDLGEFIENTLSEKFFYVLDNDRGDDLKKISLKIDPQVWDAKTLQRVPAPSGLRVEIIGTANHQPDGRGLRTRARLVWRPSDEEAKRLSGEEGFIIKVIAQDNLFNVTESLFTNLYFKIKLRNQNQTPTLLISDRYRGRIIVDTYVEVDFMLEDPDGTAPQGQSFNTRVTMCRNLSNQILRHATMDPDNEPDPMSCHANLQYWPAIVNAYDPNYQDNISVAACRVGNHLNADLAVPKISPLGGPQFLFGKVRQAYRMQWCPQKQHIGQHFATLFAVDNGDRDRDGLDDLTKGSVSPLELNVVAPIFFESPLSDIFGNPVHFMPHTSSGLVDHPFVYKTRLRNTYGHPVVYQLINFPLGMTIDAQGEIRWVAQHPQDISPDTSLGHFIKLRATDQVTQEIAEASFYLKVQNSVSPFEETPVISTLNPDPTDRIILSEGITRRFQVTASDPNPNDTLFYRWYVNNQLRDDRLPYFDYTPSLSDGVLRLSGNQNRNFGETELKVEVTDGNYVVTRAWTIQIRNTILQSNLVFDILTARQERPPGQVIQSLNWLTDIKYQQNLGGIFNQGIIFSGFYDLGAGIKHFLWDLPFINLSVSRSVSLVKGPWILTEDLPWLSGRQTQRLVWSNTNESVIVSSQNNREGGFGDTTDALIMPRADWSAANAITNTNRCSVGCDTEVYSSNQFAGYRLSYSYASQRVFFVDNSGSQLMMNLAIPSSPQSLVTNFTTDYEISGIAGNEIDNRLYVVIQHKVNGSSRLVIFNTSNLDSLSLIYDEEIWDGVAGHQANRAMQLLVVNDGNKRRVFGLLSGTGGVFTFEEQGGVPTPDFIRFIGVTELSSSASDVVHRGKKIDYLSSQRLVVGVMRDSKQAFTIDLDSLTIAVNATPEPIDSIQVFDHGLIVLINYQKGLIFVGH